MAGARPVEGPWPFKLMERIDQLRRASWSQDQRT